MIVIFKKQVAPSVTEVMKTKNQKPLYAYDNVAC